MVGDFKDRAEAGRQLAAAVVRLGLVHPLVHPLVLALPRGGVPVAAEVARALRAPLDLLIVRKIGAPGQPELAVAAMRAEIEQRCTTYRRGCARLGVAGKTVVVVDDGIATGSTVRAALQALRRMRPARLVLAVPVAPADTLSELSPLVDDVVCLSQPAFFRSIGTYYADFHQVDDEEVIALLDAAAARMEHEPAARALQSRELPWVPPNGSDPSMDLRGAT